MWPTTCPSVRRKNTCIIRHDGPASWRTSLARGNRFSCDSNRMVSLRYRTVSTESVTNGRASRCSDGLSESRREQRLFRHHSQHRQKKSSDSREMLATRSDTPWFYINSSDQESFLVADFRFPLRSFLSWKSKIGTRSYDFQDGIDARAVITK